MVDVVLFHHIQGRTAGVRDLAERIAGSRHRVHTPDLYAGRTFDSIEDGFAFAQTLDSGDLQHTIGDALAPLPDRLVYAGISWGVTHAQRLAQTRANAAGALLLEACLPVTGEWAIGAWPAGLPAQIHGHDGDEFFALEGDIESARQLVVQSGGAAQLYSYAGDSHLFCDRALSGFDAEATDLLVARVSAWLDQL